ncbi:hypothetical protein FNB15_10550 [Ferrovibrio terrae]|uniref:Uncharacterized protein n=1 Tax=Ferrovibrio terrae TaxID=2594003 RepID=A0A516H1N2_9PROT|nr:hypothetical protein [Ferrovibrio terrae]QDO97683.1 hypothetical protein FNB15_10550 [Ferrovibrio terrae]
MQFISSKVAAFRAVSHLCMLAALLTLAGCAAGTFGSSSSFDAADPKGLVILGVIEQGTPGGLVLGRFDAATRKITGVTNFGGNMGLHVGSGGAMLPDAFGRASRFYVLRMTPGDYALIQVSSAVQRTLASTNVQVTRLVDFDAWAVRDTTPVFSVRAGEAAYVGDLQVNYGMFPAQIVTGADIPAMQAFMVGFPNVRIADVKMQPLRNFQN